MRRAVRVWAPHASAVDLVLADRRVPMTPAGDHFETDGRRRRRCRRTPSPSTAVSRCPTPAASGSPKARTAGRPSSTRPRSRGPTTPGPGLRSRARSSTSCTSARSPPRAPSTPPPTGSTTSSSSGSTVVELLPLAPFPGRHGWGYDGVAPYAVHEPYGGPEALQRFVDAAHARGLAVCLDVVYNHLGPDGNRLAEFGPYFTDTHATPWGDAVNLDAAGSDEVRRWVLDNVRQWLRGLPRRRSPPRRRARAARRPGAAPAGGDVAGGGRARRADRAPALAGRRVRPQRPRDGHPARCRGRGRRAGAARAVGRRRPPRAARRADRRDAGLLRGLRRARTRWRR